MLSAFRQISQKHFVVLCKYTNVCFLKKLLKKSLDILSRVCYNIITG